MITVSSILGYMRRERDYRRTRRILHNLDDRMLLDIGVRRDDIDSLVTGMRETDRKRAAAEARNRRHMGTRHGSVGGSGLAHQH